MDDIERFKTLPPLVKLNYVVMKLERARFLMQSVYDNCQGLDDNVLLAIEEMTDDFVRFGIMAEDGLSDEIFNELNLRLEELETISEKARVNGLN